jgi:outer membrane protein assembly factor BamB
MKISKKQLLLLLFLLVLLVSVKYRAKIHPSLGDIHPMLRLSSILWKLDPYHAFRTSLFGEPAKDWIEPRLVNKEDWVTFPAIKDDSNFFREKWRFRSISTSLNNGKALVDDVDNDGLPEVFIGSGSTKVYGLNGNTGEKNWEYVLPFGITSTLAYVLADLDDDGMNEFVFGSTISHPIRIYALRTGKNEENRVYWTRNVGGDFFQAGLSSFRNSKGEVRVVGATRDAPYARGAINILDGLGERVVPERIEFDVCNNRPAYLDVNGDGELDILTGSHGFYGAKHANALTAIDAQTGKIIWSNPVGTDTGWLNFPIIDIDDDGEKEIIVPKDKNFLIYSSDGNKKGEIDGASAYLASFANPEGGKDFLYVDSQESVSDSDLRAKVLSLNLKTREINYELPLVAFGIVSILDLDGDSVPEILATLKVDSVLTLLTINAYTGKLKSIYRLNSKEEIKPKYQELELSDLFNDKIKEGLSEDGVIAFFRTLDSDVLLRGLFTLSLPKDFKAIIQAVLYERVSIGVRSEVLADIDGDGYWELLGMENPWAIVAVGVFDPHKGYYTAYDLPFPVLQGYDTGVTNSAFRTNLFKPNRK